MNEVETVPSKILSQQYGFNVPIIRDTFEPSLDYDGRLSKAVGERAACSFDVMVFNQMDSLTKGEYSGGMWDWVDFDGGFFLSLSPRDKIWPVFHAENWCNETASVVGCCIAANLVAIHKCGMYYYGKNDDLSNGCFRLYQNLKEASYDHADVKAILRYID